MFIDTYAAQRLHEQQADREAYYRSIAQRSIGDPRAKFSRPGMVDRLIARVRAHGRATASADAIPGVRLTERFVQDAAVREADLPRGRAASAATLCAPAAGARVQSGECVVV